MDENSRRSTRWRKVLRFLVYFIGVKFLLVSALAYALSTPVVQQYLTQKAQTFLQKKLGTRVEVGAVRVRFPYDVSLENFLLEDTKGDTLARVGNLVVNISMWELLHKTIELQHITLENAAVYLHKKDSLNNYDFIVNAFAPAGSAVDTTTAKPVNSPWKLQLDLAILQLRQVSLLQKDEDAATTTRAVIGFAKTTITKSDLENLDFELDGFSLSDADIQLIQQKPPQKSGKTSPAYRLFLKNGSIERSHIVYSTTEQTVEATLGKADLAQFQLHSAENLMAIQAQGIRIGNSAVNYRDSKATLTPGHVNSGDLGLSQLDADIPHFSFQNDTLAVQANAFSGMDKSGLQLHSLQTITQVTPGSIQLKNTVANVNHTHFNGDVLLLKNSQATFDRMDIQLRQAKGIMGDLIVLLPPMENPALARLSDMPYEVSGHLNGWLQNLQTNHICFRAGTGTIAHFTGSVQNLTTPTNIGMHLTVSRLATNRADLVRWMSVGSTPLDSILAQPLPATIAAAGYVGGDMSRLQLNLRGEIGPLQKGAITLPTKSAPLLFDVAGLLTKVNVPDKMGMDLVINRLDAPKDFFAFIETPNLQLPDLLQATGTLKGTLASLQTDLQFNATRDGGNSRLDLTGFLKNLNLPSQLGFDLDFNGQLTRPEILGYVADSLIINTLRLPYWVQIDGAAKGSVQYAAGKATIGLGQLGSLFLNGTLRDSTYQMDLRAQNLHVGQLVVDSTLQQIKTVGLQAQVSGNGFQVGQTAQLKVTGTFDSIIWDNLILRDIAVDADINGRRFTGGINSPDARAAIRVRAAGDFSSNIPLLDLDVSLNCIDLRAFGWINRPTTVCMRIFSHSEGLSMDTLLAKVRIEDIDLQYDTVHIRPGNLAMDVQFDNNQNQLNLVSDWLQGEIKGHFVLVDLPETIANIAEQYLAVDRTTLLPPVGTDSLAVNLYLLKPKLLTTGLIPGLTELKPVKLEGSLVAQRNYFNLAIHAPRTVYLDWVVDSLNVRSYAGEKAAMFAVTTPLVKRGEQDFIENAVLDGRFLANVADITFKANNDAGQERFALGLKALLNGKTKETVITLLPQQTIDFKAWAVSSRNQIRITPGRVEIQQLALTGNGQSLEVEGATRQLANGKTGLDFAMDIDRLDFGNFDIFVAGILSELGGWIETGVTINGTADAPQVRGTMQLHETFFTPVATNVRYELSETPLEFTATGINLDGITLRDPYGKLLAINGKLTTSDWANIQTNLTLHADRWQVLRSTKQQNPVYYGDLNVTLDGTIKGPISQPDIRLVVKTAKPSTFTYVYDVATQVLQHEGIVYFLPPPRQNVRPAIYDAPVIEQSFTLSASIEIDSNLVVNSVINPVTGDDFKGKAVGRLQFDQLSNGNMTLAGQVELVSGTYNYSYQSVVQRSFDVLPGSTILWTGDIGTPELALKARYQFKASPYPLVINQLSAASADEAAAYRTSQTFYLQTAINGSPTQPDVNFQFIYPPAEKQDGLVANFGKQEEGLIQSALGNVNQDKNQLSRQVFGVLLLRNFIGETVGSLNTGGGNSLQSGLTNFLTGQINALADQYLTWIDVDLTSTEGSSNQGASQAAGSTNYQLRLQKSFFEDRLTFKLSGGTSVGGSSEGGNDVHSALENASIEYALTPKGDLKVTVFSENGFELLNATSANLRNSGAGFILTREFGGTDKKR